jgi:hypothetical protein
MYMLSDDIWRVETINKFIFKSIQKSTYNIYNFCHSAKDKYDDTEKPVSITVEQKQLNKNGAIPIKIPVLKDHCQLKTTNAEGSGPTK